VATTAINNGMPAAADQKTLTPADIEKREGYERGVHCEPCWNRRKRVTPANGRWGSMPYCNPCRIDDRVPHREWRAGVEADEPAAQEQPQDEPLARVTTMTAASPAARAAMGKSNPVHPLEPSESADEIRREVEADIERNRPTRKPTNVCVCGCGSPVPEGRAFFRGHKERGAKIPAAAVPEVKAKQEKSDMMKKCKCGCGNETDRPQGFIWGHKGLVVSKPAGPKTVATLKVRTPAAPAVDPDAPERVQISVNAAYLDHFWQGRSIAEKARMVSNFFSEAGA
jgi:hypothetical protein